ncbi:hypothetical protein FG93_05518 [Bosea sp. LC85]|uniref:hypothetical protein n=1 Tax=Bosea sp. LC85 TaxID=1502851 RepID=UPI0004E40187|nr:hypothetical protein [Bosea sp. LC85]KFC64008.1 hypothetical protein FG93_05518 [Bosea sp. LC85]
MKRIRDAQTIIGSLEGGEVSAELSTAITGALKHLKELCGNRPKAKAKGKVALVLHLEVEHNTVTVEAEIAQTLPKKPRGSSFYWVTDEGELSTEHPQQTDMFAGPRGVAAAGA